MKQALEDDKRRLLEEENSDPQNQEGGRQPHLAFSHVQDSNLVRVVGWDLVKQLH